MKYITSFILLIGLIACSGDDADTITYDEIEDAFNTIPVQPGIQDASIEVLPGFFYDFRVIFPDVDLNQDWPMVITLHGYAGGDPDAHTYTDCYDEPGLAGLDVIILSPNGDVPTWGDIVNQDKLRILTELASRLWPVDVEKIAVMGYSGGGNGAFLYCESQPQVFSAGIAMASGYNLLRPDGSARMINVPMYAINGRNDVIFPVDTVENWINLSNQAGSDIEFVIADSLGHFTPCDYVPYVQDAAIWLEDIWNN